MWRFANLLHSIYAQHIPNYSKLICKPCFLFGFCYLLRWIDPEKPFLPRQKSKRKKKLSSNRSVLEFLLEHQFVVFFFAFSANELHENQQQLYIVYDLRAFHRSLFTLQTSNCNETRYALDWVRNLFVFCMGSVISVYDYIIDMIQTPLNAIVSIPSLHCQCQLANRSECDTLKKWREISIKLSILTKWTSCHGWLLPLKNRHCETHFFVSHKKYAMECAMNIKLTHFTHNIHICFSIEYRALWCCS